MEALAGFPARETSVYSIITGYSTVIVGETVSKFLLFYWYLDWPKAVCARLT